jgi:toxin HigB-1
MIRTFKHKGLKRFFETGSTAGIQTAHAARLRRILGNLNQAAVVADMNLPGYHLHGLSGRREGTWSVWVNGNWRVTFKLVDADVMNINYEDYH